MEPIQEDVRGRVISYLLCDTDEPNFSKKELIGEAECSQSKLYLDINTIVNLVRNGEPVGEKLWWKTNLDLSEYYALVMLIKQEEPYDLPAFLGVHLHDRDEIVFFNAFALVQYKLAYNMVKQRIFWSTKILKKEK